MQLPASYLRIAWRHLWKNKMHAAINILGLSIGMAVALLIGIWVWDELSFDHYHQNHTRIASILSVWHSNGGTDAETNSSVPLAAALKSQYPGDFARMSLLSWTEPTLTGVGADLGSASRAGASVSSGGAAGSAGGAGVESGGAVGSAGGASVGSGGAAGSGGASAGESIRQWGAWVQPDYPYMFTLPMIDGSASALKDRSSILVSASLAKALFGTTTITGRNIRWADTLNFTVGGVYADPPDNVSLHPQFLAPWDNNANPGKLMSDDWTNHHYQLYVQINDHASFEGLSAKIKDISKPYIKGRMEEIGLYPMDQWRLWDRFENGKPVAGRLESMWTYAVIGVFVLLLACINFMNLSTARSEKRARETGVRKVLGSMRWQLIGQFLGESMLTTFIALEIALALAQAALPFYNQLCDKNLTIPFSSPLFWLVTLGFTLLTGTIAGSYPAFYLSHFDPVRALKGAFQTGRLTSLPRRILVTLQFTISVSLITGAVMIFRQVQFARSRPVGYSEAGLITMDMNMPDLQQRFDALRQELVSTGGVVEAAESSSPTTNVNNSMLGYRWEGRDARDVSGVGTLFVSYSFGKTIGWHMKEGRDFSPASAADSGAFIVNEAAARYMGLKDPVGKVIRWHGMAHPIVGVVKDLVMESPYAPVQPTFFTLQANARIHYLLLRINPALPMQTALARIEPVMRWYDPGNPFEYSFTDETYGAKFQEEERTGRLTCLFAVLAMLISCLGLSGLAAFVAERRTREIGVRKVLGASVYSLWKLLSTEFALLVFIASLIAIPVTIWPLHTWLQHYAFRAPLAWWIFPVTAAGALLITLLTVSWQTVKAATANPVKSLKVE
jgi:putative ABC transport system permease protein